jgi:Ca-activated chloride channel family protein
MRFSYSRFRGNLVDAVHLEALLEHLSDFLLDGGFAGGPHFHPWWGWSGAEDTHSSEALRDALLRALLESGQLTPDMLAALRGEGGDDAELREALARLLDDLIQRMVEEGYLTRQDSGTSGQGPSGSGPGKTLDEAREAAQSVDFELTRKGMDFLGYRALRSLLGAMGTGSSGSHDTPALATGVEAGAGSRPYQFGDTMNLDLSATLTRALARQAQMEGAAHPGLPLNLEYDDLMVHQSEHRTSCASVLMLDISHSMVLYGEDRFSPAKRVALALSHLIRTQYPGDTLRVVTFGDRAQEIPLSRLGKAQVGPFHTNTAEGLEVARRILQAQGKEMRQILMITDGKPSAMTLPDGRVYVNSGGLDPKILRATYREVAHCRKVGIVINTFMLAQDPYLVEFVRKMSEIARGKAYFANTLTLGQSVMMDFLKNKGRRVS